MSLDNEADRFFELSLDMLCVASFDGYFTRLNPAWTEVLGFSLEELQSKPFIEFVHRDDRDNTALAAAGLAKGSSSITFENRYLCKDGNYKWFLWKAKADPERQRIFAVARDFTSNRHIELTLRSAKEAAEEASQTKSRFLASMSHELRTPLNAIIGYSEMLAEECAGQNLSDLGKITGAGRHLLGLINDILDLSKIEAGKMQIVLDKVDVRKLVSDLVAMVKPLLDKNANALVVECDDDVGEILSDGTRLRQVLFNLLSNAAKFTNRGSIRLSINRCERDDRELLRLSVSDTGVGMTEEQLGKIFHAFTQATPETSVKFGGTGLGLTISRHLCAMLGGDLNVQSVAGQGSTFSALLPLRRVPTTDNDERQAPLLTAMACNDLALVIDDNHDDVGLIARQLEADGLTVLTAYDGESGLDLARSRHPAFITLDVVMPGYDGWAILQVLKADPTTAAIPIIVCSHVDGTRRAYALGASEFLQKPISGELLREAVRRIGGQTEPAECAPILAGAPA